MKKSLILTLLLINYISVFSQAIEYGELTYNKAVNISGKQRMLTQRMGKIYLFLLDNPRNSRAKKDLKITKIIFEKQLLILESNTNSEVTKSRLKDVRDTWVKYKSFLESKPNKENAVKIINTNTTILKYANSVVNAIILESKGGIDTKDTYVIEEDSELKEIINKSGRQRMLSQRLALYYFANKPRLKNPKVVAKLEKVFKELDDALNFLLISNFNDERIDVALGDVSEIWDDLISKKERLFGQGFEDADIYKLSNELTKTFNTITNLYEKIKVK